MNCYVTSVKSGAEYPKELNKENTLFFPETRMTTEELFFTSRPLDYHIVTDSPFLVGLYKRDEVFVWKNGKWENPSIQTYASAVGFIIDEIWGYNSSIPQATIDHSKTTNCMGYKKKEIK